MHIDGLVQDCSNSIANPQELLQSCTKSSNWKYRLRNGGHHQFVQGGDKLSRTINMLHQYMYEGTDTNDKAEIFLQANPCAMPMHTNLFSKYLTRNPQSETVMNLWGSMIKSSSL